MRPKRNQIVEFKVDEKSNTDKSKILEKVTGKYNKKCWIRLQNNDKKEGNDFVKSVQTWKVVGKVFFSNQTVDNQENSTQTQDAERASPPRSSEGKG